MSVAAKRNWFDHPAAQGVVVGAAGAVLNRAGIIMGARRNWTPFEITLAIEIVIPFVCTLIICSMLRQRLSHSLYMGGFASLVGGITTLLTIGWD